MILMWSLAFTRWKCHYFQLPPQYSGTSEYSSRLYYMVYKAEYSHAVTVSG